MNDSKIPQVSSPQKVIDHIVDWLKLYIHQSRLNGFVIGVSGGIDSALTSTLCALTGYKTLCLEMNIHQEKKQVHRALEHITWLESKYSNVDGKSVNLTPVFDSFVDKMSEYQIDSKHINLSLANSRSRLRMVTLYYFATAEQYLVVGTGNKVEDFGVGFFTKYGDGGVDISPIADLLKSHVYQLASHLGINSSILQAQPTDGLWPDQRTDQDQLGVTYDALEWAMYQSENSLDQHKLSNERKSVLTTYQHFHNQNRHKMSPIPVCHIPKKLFN
ncbi:MAG: NAD(+) synthase [Flavobacteriaceae bacterium]|nr:NAD(+) synthase [Flavobacteriaceae bacterium]MCY4267417.1 NAD(+) synthase [Flavobacteriaceae bacterium]